MYASHRSYTVFKHLYDCKPKQEIFKLTGPLILVYMQYNAGVLVLSQQYNTLYLVWINIFLI